jgi:hypothetical protein
MYCFHMVNYYEFAHFRRVKAPPWPASCLAFHTAEVWTNAGLVTYSVLFCIHLASRKVHVAGMTSHPDERWMVPIAGQVTMADLSFLPLHADAERWVCSMKDEMRSRLMLFGEHSLWYTLQRP